MSLMKILNNRGAIIYPCGTARRILQHSLKLLFTLTLWNNSEKSLWTNFIALKSHMHFVCQVINCDLVCFFFYLGFLSQTLTYRRTAGEGGGHLIPHYHFHPLHRHLDISRAITAESLPLHIASSRTRTGNLWFPSASRYNH